MRLKKRHIGFGLLLLVALFFLSWFIFSQYKAYKEKQLCWVSVNTKLDTATNIDSLFTLELRKYQQLVEQSLVIRAEMIKIALDAKKDNQPISPKNLAILKDGTNISIDLRDQLYGFAIAYECAIDATEQELEEYNVSPELRAKAVMLSLSAALTMYDNYVFGAMIFESDKRLRRLLNDPDKGFNVDANKLLEVSLSATSVTKQQRIKKGIEFYENEIQSLAINDDDYNYLSTLIQSSTSYNHIKNIGFKEMLNKKVNLLEHISRDLLADVREEGLSNVSKVFGNAVGLVETRKGILFENDTVKSDLLNTLQPLDILLEKTPFRLTDKLIPGYFGHVAIWTGTKKDLERLNLWNHEIVRPYHNIIEQEHFATNKNVLEALREGVQLSSLDHFLNVDDVVVLRPVFPNDKKEELIKESLLLAFRQIGKEYDFNFDVNTTEKIVCSELAYVCFPTINWPTDKTLGRFTISPDNVANLCWNGVPLELVSFYHQGKKCDEENQLALLKKLMQEEQSKLQ